jgi:hypothetical protein
MLRMFSAVCLLCATAAAAKALDLQELMPCRTAAARLCDRSQGMSVGALETRDTLQAFAQLPLGPFVDGVGDAVPVPPAP